MSTRRLSKRSSAVTKRRLLEEKLEKRRVESEVRTEKARLKSIKTSAVKETVTIEKNLASEEELVENIDEEDQGNKSLEWDHSDETPPSFAEETWDSNKTVDEIIQNIEDLDKSVQIPIQKKTAF